MARLLTITSLLASCLPARAAQEQPLVKDALLFYASYDRSADADFARGDGRAAKVEGHGFVEGKAGRGLRFAKGAARVCAYKARGNIRPDQGTIAFLVRPNWSGEEFTHRHFLFYPGATNGSAGANRPDTLTVFTMKYRRPEQEIWLWVDDHGGGNNTVRGCIAHWRKGEWHHVAVTWDAQWLHIYLDGELKGRHRVAGRIAEPGDRFWVGSSRNGAFGADSVLDEFCIYGRPLSLAEIGLLTGRPELVAPRIHAMTPTQNLFFRGERRLAFRCELTGRIDPQRHRLHATLTRDDESKPIASAAFPAASGRHRLAVESWKAGSHTLRVVLADEKGKALDKRTAVLRVIDGPFDRRASRPVETR